MTVEDVRVAVEANDTVIGSTIKLLGDLTVLVAATRNDPAANDALVAKLTAQKTALADAVVANTPAA